MKKNVVCILLTIFLLCSCGTKVFNKTIQVDLPINVTASLQGSDTVFVAEINEENAVVSFDSSHTLSGTVLTLSPDGNSVAVGDIFSREVKTGIFPAQEALAKAFQKLSSLEKIENGQKYAIDEMTVIVYYDKDSKQITSIETEENGRRFCFCIISSEPQ